MHFPPSGKQSYPNCTQQHVLPESPGLSPCFGNPTGAITVVCSRFTSFLSWGFNHQRTYLLYMPLILQALNYGTAVIHMDIPQQHQSMWNRWVQTLMSQPDLPAFWQLSSIFDGLLHLSAEDQHIIMDDASYLLRQELQEFIGSLLAAHSRQSQI